MPKSKTSARRRKKAKARSIHRSVEKRLRKEAKSRRERSFIEFMKKDLEAMKLNKKS